jgi:hypothetical protein
VVVLGDLNSKLARNTARVSGRYCIHPRADKGGGETVRNHAGK